MKFPQHTTHWSAYYPVVHPGPVHDCEICERERLMDARDRAERQAERLEARIARAERLIDSWEHDAPDHSNPVFIGRLRECLHRDPAPIRLREEGGWQRCLTNPASDPGSKTS